MDKIDETVLSLQQRQKRAMVMRRNEKKIERAREMSKRKMAPESNIRKRAFAKARQIVRKRIAGDRGAEYEKLGPSEKMAIDRAVEGKQKLISKLALRLIPSVKQAESKRLASYIHGKSLKNHGQPEGKSFAKESLNTLFAESFPPAADTSSVMGPRAATPVATSGGGKKMPPQGKTKNSNIIQYNKFQEEIEYDTPAFTSLYNKSEKSGIDLGLLGKVYNRGWNTWTEDCKVNQQQYAFARVNSYINQGKTYFNEDADLHEREAIDRDEDAETKTGRKMAVGHLMGALNDREKHVITRIYTHGHTRVNIAKDLNLSPQRIAGIEARALRRMKDHSRRTGIGAQDYREETEVDESNNTPYVKAFRERGATDETGWKASNKHGKVKYFGKEFKSAAHKHAGLEIEEAKATPCGRCGTTHVHPSQGGACPALKRKNEATNENFIDGKGPGKPGDAARHGLKGKTAAELKSIRSSETASPRKKQLAHFMLNMTRKESIEETELDEKRGLWDNIHAKRKRIKAGSGERMRKPGSEGAPTKQNIKDAQESVDQEFRKEGLEDPKDNPCWKGYKPVGTKKKAGKTVPNCVPEAVQESYDVNSKHYKALTDLDLNTKNRDMTTKHDGYGPLNPSDEKGSKPFWDDKAKMWNTTVEAAMEARCGNCAAFNQAPAIMKKMAEGLGPAGEKIQELSNLGFCELFEFKCAGDRTCNKWLVNGPITEEDTENGTTLIDKQSKNSKARKSIENVDRSEPREHGKQTQILRKVIENHNNCDTPECCGQCDTAVTEKIGNSQNNPAKRLLGTNPLTKAYKNDTPAQGKNLDEAFNIAFASGVGVTLTAKDLGMAAQSSFALHPSVVEEINRRAQEEVDEEVRSADIKGEVVPAHMRTVVDPKTGAIRQVTIPGHVRRGRVNKKIIRSGNVTDGNPPQ